MNSTTSKRHPKFIDPAGFKLMLNQQPPNGAVLVEVSELLEWLVDGKSQRDFFDMFNLELEATHRMPGVLGAMIDVTRLGDNLRFGHTEREFFDLLKPDFLFNLESYWQIVGGSSDHAAVFQKNVQSQRSIVEPEDVDDPPCVIVDTPHSELFESAFDRWVDEGFDLEAMSECRRDIHEHLMRQFDLL